MSLDNFDKVQYKKLKKYFKEDGAKTCFKQYDDYTGNGVTIVYQPMTEGPDCRMLAVSVSYCSPEDAFDKKVGKYQAFLKLLRGEYVQLPLAYSKAVLDREDFEEILLEMFSPCM